MGGALVLRTPQPSLIALAPGASFHGGGLVTDKPDSPHLLAPKIKARLYIGVASNDDARQPDAKGQAAGRLRRRKGAGGDRGLPELHGWCVPDMPAAGGQAHLQRA